MGSNRMRRTRRARLWTGLVVLGAMVVVGHDAQAALSGITIRGGIIQDPGDPPYTYQFLVYTQNATFQTGDTIDFMGLVGVTPANFPNPNDPPSGTSEPGFFQLSPLAFESWIPGITLSANGGSTPPYASDVEWTLVTTQPIGSAADPNFFVGTFTVETTQSFPPGNPPIPVGSTISYRYTIDGQTTNPQMGQLTLQSGPLSPLSVPEPSTMLAVLWTVTSLPLVWHVRRRWRRRRQAA